MSKKYYRTIIKITILSDEPYETVTLEGMSYDITEGHCSGLIEDMTRNEELSSKEMAKELLNQGSDPEFLGLDVDGNEVEDL